VIDDFEFSIEELEPYLAQVFSLLFNLLKVIKNKFEKSKVHTIRVTCQTYWDYKI